jgi:hypothetical protein
MTDFECFDNKKFPLYRTLCKGLNTQNFDFKCGKLKKKNLVPNSLFDEYFHAVATPGCVLIR